MITLQFSSQNKIGSKLIQWFTWSKYSHVDFVLPDGRLLGARGDGVKIREPYYVDKKLICTVDAPESVLDYALSQKGKDYDYSALFGFILNRKIEDNSKWFCSELVAWAFRQAGVDLLNYSDEYRITPRDLLLSPLVKRQ